MAAVLLLALCAGSALAQEITVQGSGTVSVTPDIAVIVLGAQKTGEDIASIQSEANSVITAVREALTGEGGIAPEDISTNGYAIYRDYSRYYENDDPIYYTAFPTLRIVVRDIARAGAVIDLAFANGANALEDITFDREDRTESDDRALSLAVQDGIHRAQVIAGAAGLTLPAAPTVITEGTIANYQPVWRSSYDAASEKAAGAPTEIMAGSLKISATVTVTYVIGD